MAPETMVDLAAFGSAEARRRRLFESEIEPIPSRWA
jgi:hypothetical protein